MLAGVLARGMEQELESLLHKLHFRDCQHPSRELGYTCYTLTSRVSWRVEAKRATKSREVRAILNPTKDIFESLPQIYRFKSLGSKRSRSVCFSTIVSMHSVSVAVTFSLLKENMYASLPFFSQDRGKTAGGSERIEGLLIFRQCHKNV